MCVCVCVCVLIISSFVYILLMCLFVPLLTDSPVKRQGWVTLSALKIRLSISVLLHPFSSFSFVFLLFLSIYLFIFFVCLFVLVLFTYWLGKLALLWRAIYLTPHRVRITAQGCFMVGAARESRLMRGKCKNSWPPSAFLFWGASSTNQ